MRIYYAKMLFKAPKEPATLAIYLPAFISQAFAIDHFEAAVDGAVIVCTSEKYMFVNEYTEIRVSVGVQNEAQSDMAVVVCANADVGAGACAGADVILLQVNVKEYEEQNNSVGENLRCSICRVLTAYHTRRGIPTDWIKWSA